MNTDKHKSQIESLQHALDLDRDNSLATLMQQAAELRDNHHGRVVSYSRKVFIPLTQLCRDVCHYCTFAKAPSKLEQAFLSPEQIVEIAQQGKVHGCKEALFTLGDKPELRYAIAREELKRYGHETTLSYLKEVAQLVLKETGLLPHLNPGVMTLSNYEHLRSVAPSMGFMLESISERLFQKDGPHYGSPDKDPKLRLQSIQAAGESKVPLTTGILIGIGESRLERLESLFALRKLHEEYGHLQEIIIQNFIPKPDTKMKSVSASALEEILWTIAMTRNIFGGHMSIQAPPNLNDGHLPDLINAGINDWGGVSPVTPDHVNPESPWPHLDELEKQTNKSGKLLLERLTIYPDYIHQHEKWLASGLSKYVLPMSDTQGYARAEEWFTGASNTSPKNYLKNYQHKNIAADSSRLKDIINQAQDGVELCIADIVYLFETREDELAMVCNAADKLRQAVNGDVVSYVINRNINYTNVCTYKCTFCAFSKGKASANLRGEPYVVDLDEIVRRAEEAQRRGATEVCMQGGIHPYFTGQTYLDICQAIHEALPNMHIHAFSALEIQQGAQTLRIEIKDFLLQLKKVGLKSLPGTAAEILCDDVRKKLCADKLTTNEWLEVIKTAHSLDIPTTSTIMFGHMEKNHHWAQHLLHLRHLQKQTNGITEFVPLPFVAAEAPLFKRGQARQGPTFREALLMHAISRLVLHPYINNIQTSWVKLGVEGVSACLNAGANDLGGTLMNESISRAAGAMHGQEFSPSNIEQLIENMQRTPQQRSTLYNPLAKQPSDISCQQIPLSPIVNRHAKEFSVTQ